MMGLTKSPLIARLSGAVTAEQIVEHLDRDGALILERRVDETTVEHIRDELRPHLEASPTGRDGFTGHQTRRVGAIMARSQTSHRLVLDPALIDAARRLLGSHADGIQLHLTQLAAIGNGQGNQPLHRDRAVWGGHVPRTVETQFSMVWALTDFTSENGATRVVTGSHRWDDDRRAEPHEILQAEMPAGSVLVYNGSVLHGGGQNDTSEVREGLLLHYTLDWLRQEENQYLSCPPDVAAGFPPELRRLIGYDATFSMGFCSPPGVRGELVSPSTLFR